MVEELVGRLIVLVSGVYPTLFHRNVEFHDMGQEQKLILRGKMTREMYRVVPGIYLVTDVLLDEVYLRRVVDLHGWRIRLSPLFAQEYAETTFQFGGITFPGLVATPGSLYKINVKKDVVGIFKRSKGKLHLICVKKTTLTSCDDVRWYDAT